jgi:hypothetical protein
MCGRYHKALNEHNRDQQEQKDGAISLVAESGKTSKQAKSQPNFQNLSHLEPADWVGLVRGQEGVHPVIQPSYTGQKLRDGPLRSHKQIQVQIWVPRPHIGEAVEEQLDVVVHIVHVPP